MENTAFNRDKLYAVMDIGTNSVRLMKAQYDGAVVPKLKKIITTRIGEELHTTGELGENGMRRTIDALAEFIQDSRGADEILAFATSAVRDASNQNEFLNRCKSELGLTVDVVEGEREAVLGFTGAVGQGEGRLIDIGGGSTELIYGRNSRIEAAYSVPVGCVRALSRYPGETDFAAVRDWLKSLAKEPFEKMGNNGTTVFSVGGTATTLCALSKGLEKYDAAAVQGSVLTLAQIEAVSEKLGSLSIEERRKHPLLKDRADIIRYGAALLKECMDGFHVQSVVVSDTDNLEGYLMEFINNSAAKGKQ